MNSNIEHELEGKVEQLICAWLPCYEAAKSKGYPLDDYIEMGCYLCGGIPAYCDGYIPHYRQREYEKAIKFNELI